MGRKHSAMDSMSDLIGKSGCGGNSTPVGCPSSRTMEVGPQHVVLVVDDHELMMTGVVQFLNFQKDFPVAAEPCRVPAIHARLGSKPAVDAVILDIRMGRVDGILTIAQCRKEFPEIRYFVYSGCGDLGNLQRALLERVSGYIHKEDDPAEILEALQHGAPGSPVLSRSLKQKFPKAEQIAEAVSTLSKRELQLLSLMGEVGGNRELALRMGVSVKTIESHKEHLKTKLGVTSTGDLRQLAGCVAEGSLPPPG